jgi:hypothetical protein
MVHFSGNAPFNFIDPDEKTFLFKKIEIPQIDEVHKELTAFLQQLGKIEKVFNVVDHTKLTQASPQLTSWLDKSELSSVAIIQKGPLEDSLIHSDVSRNGFLPTSCLALNFPVEGCDSSEVWTSFFKPGKQTVGQAGSLFDPKTSPELKRFKYEDNNPVLLNVRVPHAIHNGSGHRRVTISLRFKEDPWHLV